MSIFCLFRIDVLAIAYQLLPPPCPRIPSLPPLSIPVQLIDIHISDRGGLNGEDAGQLSGTLTGLMVA